MLIGNMSTDTCIRRGLSVVIGFIVLFAYLGRECDSHVLMCNSALVYRVVVEFWCISMFGMRCVMLYSPNLYFFARLLDIRA